MRIGITYDLKDSALVRPELPDDLQEEFDSPDTVEAIAEVLRGLGHEVTNLGDGRELLERLLADPPDFVFNFAEGQGVGRCREARVPAVLEMLGIPYTGSDPLTLAATLDKDCAKRLVRSVGVPVPEGILIDADATSEHLLARASALSFPVIVKPAWEGSSKGIRNKCLVERPEDLVAVVNSIQRDHHQPVLIEEYIQGEELTVGILGNAPPEILGIMRVLPRMDQERFIYSLEVKRDWKRLVTYESPARLGSVEEEAVRRYALLAYQVLGCRDVSRIDFRLRSGIPYFLEVNPLPGLNPESSDLVLVGKGIGRDHAWIVQSILDHALARYAVTTEATALA